VHSLLQGLEGRQVLSDLGHWQLNQHTSDLGGKLVTDNLVNELVDQMADVFLQVGVSLLNGWDQLLGLHVEDFGGGGGLLLLNLGLLHGHALAHWHLLPHHLGVDVWVLSLAHAVVVVGPVVVGQSSSSLGALSHVGATLGTLLLHEGKQLLDNVGEVGLVRQLGPGQGVSKRVDILFPVSLISNLFKL